MVRSTTSDADRFCVKVRCRGVGSTGSTAGAPRRARRDGDQWRAGISRHGIRERAAPSRVLAADCTQRPPPRRLIVADDTLGRVPAAGATRFYASLDPAASQDEGPIAVYSLELGIFRLRLKEDRDVAVGVLLPGRRSL